MSRWVAHNGTYHCPAHPPLTVRAKRFLAEEGRAPKCGKCGQHMQLKDAP